MKVRKAKKPKRPKLIRKPELPRRRFTLTEKLVVQIRYYEKMYLISDSAGERVYTGSDKKMANSILKLLNGYYYRRERGVSSRSRK